jgi:hypothetical protein
VHVVAQSGVFEWKMDIWTGHDEVNEAVGYGLWAIARKMQFWV